MVFSGLLLKLHVEPCLFKEITLSGKYGNKICALLILVEGIYKCPAKHSYSNI